MSDGDEKADKPVPLNVRALKPATRLNESKPTRKTLPAKQNVLKAPTSDPTLHQPESKALVAPKKHLTSNNVRMSDLPDFAQEEDTWRNIFLPTLFDRFFASSEPFAKFVKGSKSFVQFVQDIVGLVYPDVEYVVHSRCPIHLVVSHGCTSHILIF